MANNHLSSVPKILSFQKFYLSGIIQFVTFGTDFLTQRNVLEMSLFLFIANQYSVVRLEHSVQPFTHRRACGSFLARGYYK